MSHNKMMLIFVDSSVNIYHYYMIHHIWQYESKNNDSHSCHVFAHYSRTHLKLIHPLPSRCRIVKANPAGSPLSQILLTEKVNHCLPIQHWASVFREMSPCPWPNWFNAASLLPDAAMFHRSVTNTFLSFFSQTFTWLRMSRPDHVITACTWSEKWVGHLPCLTTGQNVLGWKEKDS